MKRKYKVFVPNKQVSYTRRCESTNKVRFDTVREARKEMRKMEQLFNEPFNVYPCDECGGHHVGHDWRKWWVLEPA